MQYAITAMLVLLLFGVTESFAADYKKMESPAPKSAISRTEQPRSNISRSSSQPQSYMKSSERYKYKPIESKIKPRRITPKEERVGGEEEVPEVDEETPDESTNSAAEVIPVETDK